MKSFRITQFISPFNEDHSNTANNTVGTATSPAGDKHKTYLSNNYFQLKRDGILIDFTPAIPVSEPQVASLYP